MDCLGEQRTDMTLSFAVGENIRMSKDRKKKRARNFAYHRSYNYCTKRKSVLFPQVIEAKDIYITYQVGVPFLGQSRACETTVSSHALSVS